MIELRVSNLTKIYGNHDVFTDLSFGFKTGVLGISGSNGAGKSTLLQCLAGLLKPTNGRVEWSDNGTLIKQNELKNLLGFVAPYVQLYEELTALENLHFLKDLHPDKNTTNPETLTERFGAVKFQHSFYGELSTGQQQRVKLAAACIHQPLILCMDEPGSNLDKKGTSLIDSLIDTFRNENKTIIIASNQTRELDLCDKIIDLDHS
ncbi:MAG: ABC transporter ATP-binding protein [Balneolaceae bacterium]